MVAEIRCFWVEPFEGTKWRRTDTGEIKPHIRDFGVGAMYDATWLREFAKPEAEVLAERAAKGPDRVWNIRAHPDGRVLVVVTPAGEWVVDSTSSQGGFWTRTGEPPNVSATPSIWFFGQYHGWLRDGVLVGVPGKP